MIWPEVRQLIDGGIAQPVEESPVPEQLTPDRTVGFAQLDDSPAQPDDDTPEQPVEGEGAARSGSSHSRPGPTRLR
jgi:hypothetical protein